MLEPEQVIDRLELGLQILEPRLVLALDLLEKFVELSLRSLELLVEQLDPLLQLGTDVTHGWSPAGWSRFCKRQARQPVP